MVLIYKKNANICLILEPYLNRAMALEFLQVIRDSILGGGRKPTTGAV